MSAARMDTAAGALDLAVYLSKLDRWLIAAERRPT